MRVFVLTTGRTGSVTFTRSCEHITNFTAAHESRIGLADGRLDYPDQHIEVDNRLSWFLGSLGERYPDDVFYVHLVRSPDLVARSYGERMLERLPVKKRVRAAFRWLRGSHYERGIMQAFAHGILHYSPPWPEDDRQRVARLMVDTINANLREYLRDKPHMVIDITDAADRLGELWGAIGAEGDIGAARATFAARHNASLHRPPDGTSLTAEKLRGTLYAPRTALAVDEGGHVARIAEGRSDEEAMQALEDGVGPVKWVERTAIAWCDGSCGECEWID